MAHHLAPLLFLGVLGKFISGGSQRHSYFSIRRWYFYRCYPAKLSIFTEQISRWISKLSKTQSIPRNAQLSIPGI